MKKLLLAAYLTPAVLICAHATTARAAHDIPACLGISVPKPAATTKTLDIYFNAQAQLEKTGGIKVEEFEALPKCPKRGPQPADCLPANYSNCLTASSVVSLSGHQVLSLPYLPMCSRQPVAVATGDVSVFTDIRSVPGSACDALFLNDSWSGDTQPGTLVYDPKDQTFSILVPAMAVQSAPFGTTYQLKINLPIQIARNSVQTSGSPAVGFDIFATGVVAKGGSVTVATPKQTLFSAAEAKPKATAVLQASVSYVP